MNIRYVAALLGVVGLASGCLTHTQRVLPKDHGLTVQSALDELQPVVGNRADNGIMPEATQTHFQYWDWEFKQVVDSWGNTTTYQVPLSSVRYTDITNIVIETFIWISPGSPFLTSEVLVNLTDGRTWRVKPQPKIMDACMMLPPFWFFDPKWSVHRANKLADSFLFLRDLQQNPANRGMH